MKTFHFKEKKTLKFLQFCLLNFKLSALPSAWSLQFEPNFGANLTPGAESWRNVVRAIHSPSDNYSENFSKNAKSSAGQSLRKKMTSARQFRKMLENSVFQKHFRTK